MGFPDRVQLARARSGHFDLGTGYHGDLWLDLDALLLRPSPLRPTAEEPIADGFAALAEGRWEQARSAFEAGLAHDEAETAQACFGPR